MLFSFRSWKWFLLFLLAFHPSMVSWAFYPGYQWHVETRAKQRGDGLGVVLFGANTTMALPPYGSLSGHLLTDAVPSAMLDGLSSSSMLKSAQSRDARSSTGFDFDPQNPKEVLQALTEPNQLSLLRPGSVVNSPPSHFGDIMGGADSAWEAFPEFSALERVLLTANGNLQRIISSFYNEPVSVQILLNRKLGDWVYEREVELIVRSKTFCTATSKVVIHSKECMKVIENNKVGIGQLFRHFDILPRFQLLTAGRSDTGFYRIYDLTSEYLSCRILEEFPKDVFNL